MSRETDSQMLARLAKDFEYWAARGGVIVKSESALASLRSDAADLRIIAERLKREGR